MEDRGQLREKDNDEDEEQKYSGVVRARGKAGKFNCYCENINKRGIQQVATDFLRDAGKIKEAFTFDENENKLNKSKVLKQEEAPTAIIKSTPVA
jgi:hypothetical protein